MHLLAAEGDTWGIAGPTFVKIYLIAAIASLVVTLIVRRWLGRGRRVRRELHPYEVAYLIGGRPRTIATAVAALRADGAIEASDDRRLSAAPLPQAMRDPLDAAIHTAVRTGRITSARRLATGYDVRQALDKIQDTLAGDGLVTGPRRRRWFRLSLVLPAGVLGIGIVRMVAGVQNDRPVGNLVVMLIALAAAAVVLLRRVPHVLRSGRAAVQAVRSRSTHLDPSMSPAWATYGVAGAALGVALFGMPALTSIDPEFAEATGLQHQLASTMGSAGGSGTPYTSCGSSCGGGSGCGGGSSCGGGGCGG
jgi:uncharacterized protein (TIGR04222 family)